MLSLGLSTHIGPGGTGGPWKPQESTGAPGPPGTRIGSGRWKLSASPQAPQHVFPLVPEPPTPLLLARGDSRDAMRGPCDTFAALPSSPGSLPLFLVQIPAGDIRLAQSIFLHQASGHGHPAHGLPSGPVSSRDWKRLSFTTALTITSHSIIEQALKILICKAPQWVCQVCQRKAPDPEVQVWWRLPWLRVGPWCQEPAWTSAVPPSPARSPSQLVFAPNGN